MNLAEANTSEQDPKIAAFHIKRKQARSDITDTFSCYTHSLPGKPALCWQDPVQNQCYPITEGDLNCWSSYVVSCLVYTAYCLINSTIRRLDSRKGFRQL